MKLFAVENKKNCDIWKLHRKKLGIWSFPDEMYNVVLMSILFAKSNCNFCYWENYILMELQQKRVSNGRLLKDNCWDM